MRPYDAFRAYVQQTGMFFQYPARTEEVFAALIPEDAPYMPIPWATIIDKRYDLDRLRNALASICATTNPHATVTCCQHIYWRRLLPLMTSLGIRTVYTPHKLPGEDLINGVHIIACPLFAVNAEDMTFASLGTNTTLAPRPAARDLFYSFIGAYAAHYISDVRVRLFAMAHPADTIVRAIDAWHLEGVVYTSSQNARGLMEADPMRDARTAEYNDVMKRSVFALCPSGAGPNTIRFWEALAFGTVPVILSDGMCLPATEDGDDWGACTVRLAEDRLATLEATLRAIPADVVARKREACVRMYRRYGLHNPRHN